jgi:FlaA1/EpsC-like NDP-sugar epimerase
MTSNKKVPARPEGPAGRWVMGLIEWAGRHRRVVSSLVYSAVAAGALALAYLTRFEFDVRVVLTPGFAQALGLLIVIRLGINHLFQLGISRWRYVGTRDAMRLLGSTTVGSVVFLSVSWSVDGLITIPRSVILLEWVFTAYVTGGVWVMYRLAFESYRVRRGSARVRILMVGAGEAGQMLVAQMLRSGAGYLPVALVDDNAFMWGTRVHGVEVVGSTSDVASVCEAVAVDEIVVGIPSATRDQLRQVIERCERTGLPVKILPGMDDVLNDNADLAQVRDVRMEDLLGRDPVRLELPEITEDLRGCTVMVTGAAGSIGSELARQIALNGPRCLVLYDQAETPLYYLELELQTLAPDVHLATLVASVTDSDALFAAFERYGPDRVFHAAAYKHVPLMEHNRRAAVLTNVLGTYLVAVCAAKASVASFVLVSTDKAVRPSSVMGATKQLAERVVLALQRKYPGTSFGAVRFGNVLGSNGSVVPLFRKQMERGEALTVTSEEVTRYFMTIPEAVQLILRASLLKAFPGHVAMLDMGKPIRILDLARDLLRLSGKPFRLGENVVITGLRPGEKLHEDLSDPDETVNLTENDRVFVVETPPGYDELPRPLATALADADAEQLLHFLVSEFPAVAGRRGGLRNPESQVRHAGTHP